MTRRAENIGFALFLALFGFAAWHMLPELRWLCGLVAETVGGVGAK